MSFLFKILNLKKVITFALIAHVLKMENGHLNYNMAVTLLMIKVLSLLVELLVENFKTL